MKYLVLGPAAMGYFSFLGYLKSIENKLKEVEEISGSSAGAIIALFLTVGLTIDQIVEFSLSLDVPEFVKLNIGCFFNKFGFVDIDPIRSKLIELCRGNPKFKDIKKKIYISAFCLNTSKTHYFSVDTHPDMYIIDAVCMSMSIPFIFTCNTYQGFTYVDGGTAEMIPFTPFIDKKPCHVHCVMLKDYTTFQEEIKTPMQFLESLIKGALKNRLDDYNRDITKIKLDVSQDINIFNFEMSYEDKIRLYIGGLNNLSDYIYDDTSESGRVKTDRPGKV